MADPFFTTGKNLSNDNGPDSEITIKNRIKELLSQQSQIQDKYKELKSLLNDNSLSEQQKKEIKEQMDKLSELYSKNKILISDLSTNISGEKEIVTNKNVKVDENSKTRNISFGKVMIGCGILLLLLIGGLALICYALIKNPSRLSSVGIDGCIAVQLVQTFSIIFFGILLILGLGILIVNAYKLISVKRKRKFPYIVGSVLGLVMSIFVGILLAKIMTSLSVLERNCKDIGNTSLISPMVEVYSDKWKKILLPQNAVWIAPIKVGYSLNNTEYTKKILPKLGGFTPSKVVLECGNGESLILGSNNQFNGSCFYTRAGNYPLSLIVYYYENGQESSLPPESLGTAMVQSEISIISDQISPKFEGSEIIVGSNPVTVTFDSASVFRDLSIYDYEVLWYVNCNGIADSINHSLFSYQYPFEGVKNVCVMFPGVSEDYIYTFPIRVEQGNMPDDFTIDYKLYLQTPSNISFREIDTDDIMLSEIPSQVKIELLGISPKITEDTQIKVYKDSEIIPSTNNIYLIPINEDRKYSLKIEVVDTVRGLNTAKVFDVDVKKADIIGNISVSPNTVGTSPFTVKFDASTTTLHDSDDEIIYFTRDFGDGIQNKNTSQSIIEHTYEYDLDNENGVYYPSVTIRTKKGQTRVISGTIISVKKPETKLEIILQDHPAQMASVGENISMNINVDGNPSKVLWSFGDGKTFECSGRSCLDVSHIYTDPDKYTVSVNIEFPDRPSLQGAINLVIKQ